jgi:hypothetical protein
MNDLTFVVRGDLRNMGWIVRSQGPLGEGPVGPRLAKGTRFPLEIGINFDLKQDAEKAAEEWENWYYSQPYLKKKRPNKYIA